MSLGNRYSQANFSQTPSINTPRSTFDRSFGVKLTFDFDKLIPFFTDEILPGDTVNLTVQSFSRLAPQVRPVMDNMFMDFWFFFVPNRLVWNNWEKFMGAQENPGDSTDYLVPQVTWTGANIPGYGGFADMMGILPGVTDQSVCAFPFRGARRIWNEWFRDQDYDNSLFFSMGDGPDDGLVYDVLLSKNKKHDYFNSARPWPQKGPAVGMLLTPQIAPVLGIGLQTANVGSSATVTMTQTGNVAYTGSGWNVTDAGSAAPAGGTGFSVERASGNIPNIRADLSQINIHINNFRQAIQMQSFLELQARGGTRYVEILLNFFRVVSPDFRLQRTEYLSGGTQPFAQHVVPQTSAGTEDSPQGNLAAFSTNGVNDSNIGFTHSFVEHGWVIGFCLARGEITYQQGTNRKWFRKTKWDYYWPQFQEVGEQEVYARELVTAPGGPDAPANKYIAGYQERYAEYKYMPSEVRGLFRSGIPGSLDVWHLAQELDYGGGQPAVTAAFLKYDTPIDRTLVITEGQPQILGDFWFRYIHSRPMATKPVPASLGRF